MPTVSAAGAGGSILKENVMKTKAILNGFGISGAEIVALPPRSLQAEPGSPAAPTGAATVLDVLDGLPGALPEPPEIVLVCAWCDRDKSLTKHLTDLGFSVSHGCCEKCATAVFNPPQFMEEFYELVGTEWKCRGVIPRIASGGRKTCWEGKLEYDLTAPLTVQRCFREYVIKASAKKPVRVRTILLPLTLKK
jgi:hypothetical protein